MRPGLARPISCRARSLVLAILIFTSRLPELIGVPRLVHLLTFETCQMLAPCTFTVATHDLAIGVIVGVLVAMVAFARRVAGLNRAGRRMRVRLGGMLHQGGH